MPLDSPSRTLGGRRRCRRHGDGITLEQLVDVLSGGDPQVPVRSAPSKKQSRRAQSPSSPRSESSDSTLKKLSRPNPDRRRLSRRAEDERLKQALLRADRAESELTTLKALIKRGLRGY